MMDRRRFLVTSLAGVLAGPPAAEAQAVGKVYRVGLVAITPVAGIVRNPTHPFHSFRREMKDRGYVEGQNFVLELRSLEGKMERASEVVTELVRLNVDVLVTATPEMTRQAQRVTTTVPIATFSRAPVEEGLVGQSGAARRERHGADERHRPGPAGQAAGVAPGGRPQAPAGGVSRCQRGMGGTGRPGRPCRGGGVGLVLSA